MRLIVGPRSEEQRGRRSCRRIVPELERPETVDCEWVIVTHPELTFVLEMISFVLKGVDVTVPEVPDQEVAAEAPNDPGALAMPHGAFSFPCSATRALRRPPGQ